MSRMSLACRIDRRAQYKVTHYCGAPIVHQTLINAPAELKRGIDHRVSGMVAGAAPPAATAEGLEKMGFSLAHVYGLTEVYGPATVCAKHEEWEHLPLDAAPAARRGPPGRTRCSRRLPHLRGSRIRPRA